MSKKKSIIKKSIVTVRSVELMACIVGFLEFGTSCY